MTHVGSHIAFLLEQAQQGNNDALGDLLETHRNWLRFFASGEFPHKIHKRLDHSDVIQQTMLSAFRKFEDFQGQSPLEFQIWLRRIHERNVLDTIRFHVNSRKRSVNEEADFVQENQLPTRSIRRSVSDEAMMGEDALRLADSIERLPPDQRDAIRMRFIDRLAVVEIGERMERSREAAAGLIKRGLRNLRHIFSQGGEIE